MLTLTLLRQTWQLPGDQKLACNAAILDEGRPESPDFWDQPPRTGAQQKSLKIIAAHEDGPHRQKALWWGNDHPRYPQVMIMTMMLVTHCHYHH